ncbi:MAG TPA: MG2 domain-containing protein, partial [Pyrinomonadaceae bacterium]|nr:MG2 domain-containing protein [Pyrinomonadaceae bacterium]
MSRRCLLFLVCLGCALPFLGKVTNARFNVSVDEAATRIYLKELAPEVSLVVANGSKDPLRARVRLELLGPNNKVSATTERIVDLKSGTQKIPFTLPFKTRDLTPDEEDEVLWYRLHYRIAPENPGDPIAEGFISLSEITPDLFELRIIGPRRVSSGKIYAPRVRASHPITGRPLKNVVVKGVINTTDDADRDISLTSSDVTDSEGFADLNFKLPAESSGDDFEVNIEGTLGLVTVKAEHEVDLYNQPYLLISTDKPLYQPGQTVYTRLLLLGPSKRALGNKDIEFKVTDPEDTVVASSTLKTSRFGIASTEWAIPDSTRLGDYRVEFSMADDDDYSSRATVKVSRYELPNFRVNVKPDRSYYLPGQNAELEIRADYLFGNPVSKGHVRVVRETKRTWDYREQKYETTEGDSYEGDTLADGSFKAHLDLKDDHNKLGDEDYNRFNDLTYAAYFTDPTTNRTEQRRFQIRVTKDAIHLYVIRPRDSYYENLKLPLEFYVSTFYADGTPAPSNLTISLAGSSSQKARALRQTRTNRYGLVKIDQLRVSSADLENSALDLEMLARDKDGNIGKHAETLSVSDAPVIQVKTTKTLLAQGEPIEVSI